MIQIQEVGIKIFLRRLYLGTVYRTRVCLGKKLKNKPMTLRALMQATEAYISGLSMFVKEHPDSALQSMIKHVADDKECVQKEIKEYSTYAPLEFSINGFFSESSHSEKLEKLLYSITVLYLEYEKIKMNPRSFEANSFLGKLQILKEKIYDLLHDVLTLALIMLRLDKKRHGFCYSEKITRFTQAHHFFQGLVHSVQDIEKRLSKHLYCSPYVLYQGSKQDSAEEDFSKEPSDIQEAVKKILDPGNVWCAQESPYAESVCGLSS